MASFGIDRETLLDLTVNVVPLAIILLFAAVAVVVSPIGPTDLFTEIVELGLLAVPFVVLAVVTYIAGRAVMLDEEHTEPETAPDGPPGTGPVAADEAAPAAGTAEREPAESAAADPTEPDGEPAAADPAEPDGEPAEPDAADPERARESDG